MFLLKKLNNSLVFVTPVVEKWLIQMKRLVAVDRTTAQLEVVRKSLDVLGSYRVITVFTQQYICIWACLYL